MTTVKGMKKIKTDAQKLCDDKGLSLIDDDYLLTEITGLVESPFCIMGTIDKKFLGLPPEVLQTSMKTHQKFLSVANADKKIVGFITVANKYKPSKSVQETILAGNQKVLSARLADAKFFWENDMRDARNGMKTSHGQLQRMTFHNKLGTQAERVERIANLACLHADLLDVKPDYAKKTAEIMKFDLCSEMVGEFPELQGIMGGYYAKHAGYSADIATGLAKNIMHRLD